MANKYTAPNDYRAFCEMLGETENSMSHHGVKGMHWGERKYQNYDGSLTSEGRKHYGYGESKKKKSSEDETDRILKEIGDKFNFNTKYTIRDPLVKKAIAESKKWNETRTYDTRAGEREAKIKEIDKITTTSLGAAALGGVIGGGVPSAIASYSATIGINSAIFLGHSVKAANANRKLKKTIDEISANTNVDKKTGLKKKQKEMSQDEDMEMINPGFKNWSDNTKSNCFLCTTAYDLRRKGYDVTANGASDGYDSTAALAWYPKASMTRLPSPPNFNKETQQTMMKVFDTPEGGYGNLSVSWKKGGGHSMVYAVENGVPVIRDCQSNKVYRGSACNKIFKASDELRYTRLDNVQPDISEMKKWGAINPAGQDFKPIEQAANNKNKTTATNMQAMNHLNMINESARQHQEIVNQVNLQNHLINNQINLQNHLINNQINLQNHLNMMPFTGKNNKIAPSFIKTAEQQKMYASIKDKTFDGKSRGFDTPVNLTMVQPALNKAIYSTSKGNTRIYVETDPTSNTTNRDSLEKNLKTANYVATSKDFGKELKTKTEVMTNLGIDKKDVNTMMKNAKISWIEVYKNGDKGTMGIRTKDINGNKQYLEAGFMTLPNGKIIPIDPYLTDYEYE